MKQKNSETFKESLKAQYREQLRVHRLQEKSGIIELDTIREMKQRMLEKAAQLDGLSHEDIEDLLNRGDKECA